MISTIMQELIYMSKLKETHNEVKVYITDISETKRKYFNNKYYMSKPKYDFYHYRKKITD